MSSLTPLLFVSDPVCFCLKIIPVLRILGLPPELPEVVLELDTVAVFVDETGGPVLETPRVQM